MVPTPLSRDISTTHFPDWYPKEPQEDSSLNVPLLVGLISGLGTLFIGFLCGILWFAILGRRRIKLGDDGSPGDYDDEEAEQQALETMDEASRYFYNRAKAFISANPPNSLPTDISLSQYLTIQEKGVSAWEFEVDFPNANCFVEARTEIEFFDDITCCSQTNLPVPRQNEVYYWEAKIYEKPENTLVSVGLTTKPYPTFRLPGFHKYSVAYDSEGRKRINRPFEVPVFGPTLQQGDVLGVGYRPRTGTVFFTRNGKKLEDALHGMRLNLFPTVGATGPCKVHVNFGQAGFVFIEANVKKWGLAPANGSLAPPPPYGAEQEFVLLESAGAPSNSNARETPPPIQRTVTTSDESIILPTSGEDAPDQVNINLSNFLPVSEQPAKYTRHATSSQALLVHTPPPSYTSESESMSSIEDNIELRDS